MSLRSSALSDAPATSSPTPAPSESAPPTSQNFPKFPISAEATPPCRTPTEETTSPDDPPPSPEQIPDPEAALSPRQITALEYMLAGASDVDIAATLSISRRTLYNWRTHHPTFKAALAARRDQLFQQNSDRLRTVLTNALTILDKQIRDPYATTAHRAARTVLTLTRLGQAIQPTSET